MARLTGMMQSSPAPARDLKCHDEIKFMKPDESKESDNIIQKDNELMFKEIAEMQVKENVMI